MYPWFPLEPELVCCIVVVLDVVMVVSFGFIAMLVVTLLTLEVEVV